MTPAMLTPSPMLLIGTRQLDDHLCPVDDASDDVKLVSVIRSLLLNLIPKLRKVRRMSMSLSSHFRSRNRNTDSTQAIMLSLCCNTSLICVGYESPVEQAPFFTDDQLRKLDLLMARNAALAIWLEDPDKIVISMLPSIFHSVRDCHFGPIIVNRISTVAGVGPNGLTSSKRRAFATADDSFRKKGKTD